MFRKPSIPTADMNIPNSRPPTSSSYNLFNNSQIAFASPTNILQGNNSGSTFSRMERNIPHPNQQSLINPQNDHYFPRFNPQLNYTNNSPHDQIDSHYPETQFYLPSKTYNIQEAENIQRGRYQNQTFNYGFAYNPPPNYTNQASNIQFGNSFPRDLNFPQERTGNKTLLKDSQETDLTSLTNRGQNFFNKL